MPPRKIYKVIFQNRGQVYEVYAKSVSQGPLFGFIEIEEILFGERSSVVVDPSEESLKAEFKDVERSYVPMQAVVRIDEVTKEGVSRISKKDKSEGNLTPFPAGLANRPGKPGNDSSEN